MLSYNHKVMISVWLKETEAFKHMHKLYLKKQVNASLQPLSIIHGYNLLQLISDYTE